MIPSFPIEELAEIVLDDGAAPFVNISGFDLYLINLYGPPPEPDWEQIRWFNAWNDTMERIARAIKELLK